MSNDDPSEREKFELEKAQYNFDVQRYHDDFGREARRSAEGYFTQTNEASVNNANVAIRTLILINGGAALALLTFIGTLVSHNGASGLAPIIRPLMCFVWGVTSGTLGAGMAFFVSRFYLASSASMEPLPEHPWWKETEAGKRLAVAGTVCTWLGVAAAFVSLGFFVYGMIEISAAIIEFTGTPYAEPEGGAASS